MANGVGPVALDVAIKFRRELCTGDEVDISCEFQWGEGKIFHIQQEFRRADSTHVASLTGTAGLLDLQERRLIADPHARFLELAQLADPMSL